jgi:hypothetical protein
MKIILYIMVVVSSAFATYYIGTYWDVWLYVAKDVYKVGWKEAMYEHTQR